METKSAFFIDINCVLIDINCVLIDINYVFS